MKEIGKSCPLCNEKEYTLVYEKDLERTLKSLQVQCTHAKEGCEWVGELGHLDLHLNLDPEMGKQLIGCQFAEIKCSYCDQYYQRHYTEAHEVDFCPQRPFSCDYCNDFFSVHDDVVNNHWPLCKCYPMPCPNKCGAIPERQHVEKHVNTECPLTVVDCDFCYIGCDVQLTHKEMSAHMQENSFRHITLLALHNQKLAEENLKLDRKMDEREEQLVKLKNDLKKELDELAENNLALRREIAQLRKQQQESRIAMVIKLTRESEARKKEIARLQTQQTKASTKEDLDTKRLKEHVSALDRRMVEKDEHLVKFENDLKKELAENNLALRREIAQLREYQEESSKTMVNTLKRESDARKKEIAKLQTQQTKASTKEDLDTKRLKEQVSELDQKHTQLQLNLVKEMQKQKKDTRLMQSHMGLLPVEIEMPNFSQHKHNSDQWHSQPFYTHPQGYKMHLRVDPNGSNDGNGTHVSVFLYLMRGEFDDRLKWPFRGNIIIKLHDQERQELHTKIISYTSASDICAGRVIGRESSGWGFTKFIKHTELVHKYVNNDCLCFRVSYSN